MLQQKVSDISELEDNMFNTQESKEDDLEKITHVQEIENLKPKQQEINDEEKVSEIANALLTV